jgi:hypothetical protein
MFHNLLHFHKRWHDFFSWQSRLLGQFRRSEHQVFSFMEGSDLSQQNFLKKKKITLNMMGNFLIAMDRQKAAYRVTEVSQCTTKNLYN